MNYWVSHSYRFSFFVLAFCSLIFGNPVITKRPLLWTMCNTAKATDAAAIDAAAAAAQ